MPIIIHNPILILRFICNRRMTITGNVAQARSVIPDHAEIELEMTIDNRAVLTSLRVTYTKERCVSETFGLDFDPRIPCTCDRNTLNDNDDRGRKAHNDHPDHQRIERATQDFAGHSIHNSQKKQACRNLDERSRNEV